MVTDGNQIYSDYIEIYGNIKSLCCVTGTNNIKHKFYFKTKKSHICGYHTWGWGKGELVENSQNINFHLED